MKNSLICFLIFCISIKNIFASVELVGLLPNPAGDDSLGEYIEIRNTACFLVNIGEYTLSDGSGKYFTVSSGTLLLPHENKKFLYNETRLSLNNSGEEIVILKNADGTILDTYSYSGTQKEDIVLEIGYIDEVCHDESYSGANMQSGDTSMQQGIVFTGNTFAGEMNSNSGNITLSSEIILTEISQSNSGKDTGTGGLSGTGNSIFNSGNLNTGGIDTFTGIISSTSETSFSGDNVFVTSSSESIMPLKMYYSDENNNGSVDTLEVLYPSFLTGIVNTGAIFLFSKSGGLSREKIDTQSGWILDGTLSGKSLILTLKEGDLLKKVLNINNSTTSDLRLKSTGNLGFLSSDGAYPIQFYLTSSFSNYLQVYKKGEIKGEGYSNDLIHSVSGVTITGSIFQARFPDMAEITPKLQSPSNVTLIEDTFFCNVIDCKLNISLESMFLSGLIMRNYICRFGSGELLETDTDCNPNTYYFNSSGSFIIEIALKNDANSFIRKEYKVDFSSVILSGETVSKIIFDTGKPKAILEIDGEWKEYYEPLGDYEMNCYALTCSLNFTAEKSFDPEGSPIRYLWIYGRNEIKTTKDPGSIKYELGDHRLTLRVIDAAGNYDEVIYITHVLGEKPKTTKEKNKKNQQKEEIKKISSKISGARKKFKKLEMEFFSLPTLILQGKTGKEIRAGTYQCTMKIAKTCSVNFSITGALSTFEYVWYLDDKFVFRGKNPGAWKLNSGKHVLVVETYRKNATVYNSRQEFIIYAKKGVKKTKAKIGGTQIKKRSRNTALKIIPSVDAMNSEKDNSEESNTFLVLFLLSLGLIFGYFLKGRKKGNHSS